MNFLWPGFFLLLALIPLVIAAYIWMLRRRRRYVVRYSSLSLVRSAHPQKSHLRRHLPFALFTLALTGLVLALTRPVTTVPVPASQATIILAIDISRSMCATDIQPNRLESAKDAALSFVRRQEPNTQIGIVAFAGFAAIVQTPTNDQRLLQEAITNLDTARRTAIGSGILESIDAIAEVDESIPPSVMDPLLEPGPEPVPSGSFVPAIIVLLTDGVSNSGPFPIEAAQQAVDRGIRVYTIGFGTDNENISMPNCSRQFQFSDPFGGGGSFFGGGFRRGIDEETLIEIAEMTGGDYYAATSSDELQAVFRNLPSSIIIRRDTIEISAAFAALGALLAMAAILLSLLWHPLP